MSNKTTSAPKGRRVRPLAAMAITAVALLGVASCGDDDDEPTAEEAYCEAGDSLETDVETLVNLDVVAEGTDGVSAALDAVKSDADAMKEAASEINAEPIDEFESAVGDLSDALSAIGEGELTDENVSEVLGAVGQIGTSAEAVYTSLTETCG